MEELSTQAAPEKTTVEKKPAKRRAKRQPRVATNPTRMAVEAPPEAVDRKPSKPIPRVSKWVAREEVMWSHSVIDGGSYLYPKGTIIEVVVSKYEEPHRFDYSREFWFPEGMTVIDPRIDRVLPRQFEPLDFDILVDPKMVNYARNKIPTKKAKFQFKSEVDDPRVSIDLMADPEPLNPNDLVNPPEETQKFNPSDPSARPGMKF